jgi:hypothetical protein
MTKFLPFILLAGVTFAQAQTNRYNVLFIAVDDLHPHLPRPVKLQEIRAGNANS